MKKVGMYLKVTLFPISPIFVAVLKANYKCH